MKRELSRLTNSIIWAEIYNMDWTFEIVLKTL